MKMKLTEKEKLANGLVIQELETIEKQENKVKSAIQMFVLSAYAIDKNNYHPRAGFKRLADEILLNILPIVYHFSMEQVNEYMNEVSKKADEMVEGIQKNNKEK